MKTRVRVIRTARFGIETNPQLHHLCHSSNEIEMNSDLYECSLQLTIWAKGRDLLAEILEQIEQLVTILELFREWKRDYLLHPKPTLSTPDTFAFWAESSIIGQVLPISGVRGGFRVSDLAPRSPDSSTYRGKKQSPRPRRILLDIGCDSPALIHSLTQLGLEVELVWQHTAGLLNYEIIEICTAQYIDLVVSSNERILTLAEEWLTYLMPHRTRLFLPSQNLLKSPDALAQAINQRAWAKRKRKRGTPDQLKGTAITSERKQ